MLLRTRLTLCLLVPLVVTAGLVAAVGSLGLLKAHGELVDARYRFVAGQIRSTVEQGLTIGLPLADLRQTADILSRTAARDPDIASIIVFGGDGRVRFATDSRRVGEPAEEAAALPGDPVAPPITVEDLEPGRLALAPLANAYGDRGGGLAVRYGLIGETVRVEHTVAVVAGTALGLAVAGMAVLLLAARGVLAGPRRNLARVTARFSALASRPQAEAGDSMPAAPPPRDEVDLDGAAQAFEARSAAAWRTIVACHAEIERLDELA
jgi:hypothetical protein